MRRGANLMNDAVDRRPAGEVRPGPVPRRIATRTAPRTSAAHTVLGAMLAVLALVGCVVTILLLATQPTAARLQRDVGVLDARLATADRRLAGLEKAAAAGTAGSARVAADVRRLQGQVRELARTVHGLQVGSLAAQQRAAGLRVCIPELQQELDGLTLRTRSQSGRVSSVGLSDATAPSPACRSLFAGL